MSLPIPLSVTLSTARATRRLTAQVRDLSFRTVVPGGFAAATISLHRPLTVQPAEIAYYGRLLVHDTRTGRVVWEGRVEDPGRAASDDGAVWELAAIGPSGHVHDRSVPLIYVDVSLERWRRHSSSLRAARTETVSGSDDTPSLSMSFDQDANVTTGETATMIYRGVRESGQQLARVRALITNGGTSTLWENQLMTAAMPAGATVRHSATWSTTPTFIYAELGGTPSLPAGEDVALYRLQRVGASGTATANSWGLLNDVIVRAVLKDASGADITAGYTTNTVFASQVVTDLLGRFLNLFDGPNATVETTVFPIDQLAYPDGVTPAEVLDDLMLIEPDFYWAAWEADAAGLYRFEWRTWPTEVRYEADVTDGYESVDSASGLFNAVNVRWFSPQGNIRIRKGTQTVPELDDAGIVREETVDLGDNIASLTIGDQVRDAFLADHRAPPNSGRLTIARPIRDMDSGLSVMPWEIRPGHLIRLRGVMPRVDALNATGRDGTTVFKIVSTEFNAGSASAVLDLDSPAPTTARVLADLTDRRRRRR